MYRYDEYDQRLVDERVAQFRDQTRRYLAGELSDEQFRPLRLMNGLYIQRHAPMLRVAVPYGVLSSTQMRMLARIAREHDRGYGHFTTRQNIQYNWPPLEEVPDILEKLASVQMHAIQTSGNCIRNVTSDHLAGVVADEVEDPRPWCELIRQWSTLHPEFSFLPRKFKIAVTGAARDRAASQVHDIGLHLVRNDAGQVGFEVLVGGGLGRTPMIGHRIREFLPKADLLSYLEAILRVYNEQGRRDNLFKARIKILVNTLGAQRFRDQVEAEWVHIRHSTLRLEESDWERVQACFEAPNYTSDAAEGVAVVERERKRNPLFEQWYSCNTRDHKVTGYRIVYASLKAYEKPPGDIDAEQMEAMADLADRYSFGELRSSHDQNLLLPDVALADLPAVWRALSRAGLATPNIGTVTDIIACPGLDFCSLANAASISVANDIQARFKDLGWLHELGELRINISGCMNACGHHHVGHIGILGVEKNGEEWYQLTLGGSSSEDAALGIRLGRAVPKAQVADTVARIAELYRELRRSDERLVDTVRRLGVEPFKEVAYALAA